MITLGATAEGRRVRIWVCDTGVGISQAEIDRVFDPFFQADRGRTRRFSGVGLGLTIARDLARRMEGGITIASKTGERHDSIRRASRRLASTSPQAQSRNAARR